jgi:membrane associated rhomboid family serine protease
MRTPVVRRGSDPSWLRPITDRLSTVIKLLVIADALMFAFYLVVKPLRGFFDLHLALTTAVLRGEVWQLVTSLFVHVDPINFFFNVLGLWFAGATIERQVGTRRFLLLFFVSGLVSNLILVLLAPRDAMGMVGSGCGSSVLALYVAFGTIFDRTPSRVLGGLVLEARVLTFILIGFVLLVDLTSWVMPFLAAHVSAILLGYVMAGGRGAGIKRMFGGMRAKRQRRRYQVLEGGRGGKPPYLN